MICLGIDVGTQSLKVVVVEDARIILGSASSAYEPSFPQAGFAEQDSSLWLEALAEAVPLALQSAGRSASEIEAIGVAAQLDGCLAVDAAGQAISECLIWMDRRATLPTLPDDFRARTGLHADASHMAAKIRYLQAQGIAAARWHQPTSYLVEVLCGSAMMDHALASTTMLYDLAARDYDSELLDGFGVSRASLPVIAAAESVAGRVSAKAAADFGLPEGVPVAVGTGDDFATALGAGLAEAGKLLCIVGTAEVVGAVSTRPVIDGDGLVETHGYLAQYFVENPGWLSGGAVVWCRQLLGIESDAGFDELAAQAPVGCEGLSFIPALTGAMAPVWHSGARACFYGLTAGHGPAHMARAVLEGCAFAMRDVRDRLLAMGIAAEPIVFVGGGAHSDVWAQMRADLCQVEVHAQDNPDACALGASLLAHAAIDPSVPLTALAKGLSPSARVFVPDPARASAYQLAYERYHRLFAAITPLF